MRKRTVIGLVALIAFTIPLVMNFGDQVGGYADFVEAEKTGSRAHVVGKWVRDQPSHYDPQSNIFTFYMQDELGAMREVTFRDPKPANFEDAEQLVVEGQVVGNAFEAEHILVKCPSKYNDARGLQETTITS